MNNTSENFDLGEFYETEEIQAALENDGGRAVLQYYFGSEYSLGKKVKTELYGAVQFFRTNRSGLYGFTVYEGGRNEFYSPQKLAQEQAGRGSEYYRTLAYIYNIQPSVKNRNVSVTQEVGSVKNRSAAVKNRNVGVTQEVGSVKNRSASVQIEEKNLLVKPLTAERAGGELCSIIGTKIGLHINADDLQRIGVLSVTSAVSSYCIIEGETIRKSNEYVKRYDCVLAFEADFVPEYYKLYAPKKNLTKEGGKSIYIQTGRAYLDKAKTGEKYTIGISTLQAGRAYLVEGEADYIAMKLRGYNVFTAGGAGSTLTERAIREIQARGVTGVAICYDTDLAGQTGSEKIQLQLHEAGFETTVVRLPKLEYQTALTGKPQENDVCDYIGRYGFDADLQAVLSVNFTENTVVELQGKRVVIPILRAKEYVSERLPEITAKLLTEQKIVLVGQTGGGKTWAAIELANNLYEARGVRTCIVVPTIAAAEQVSALYKIPMITGKSNDFESGEIDSYSVVLATYDSVHKAGERGCLIIDEQHIATRAAYRKEALNKLHKLAEKTKYVLAITGTPSVTWTRLGYNFVKLSLERCDTFNFGARFTDNKAAMFGEILRVINQFKAQNKRVAVRIDSSNTIDELIAYLQARGVTGVKIDKEQFNKQTDITKQLQTEKIGAEYEVIVSTQILDTAVNIRGAWGCVCVNPNIADDIIQFCSRFRDEKNKDCILLFNKGGKDAASNKATSDILQSLYDFCKKITDKIDTINTATIELSKTLGENFGAGEVFTRLIVPKSDTLKEFIVEHENALGVDITGVLEHVDKLHRGTSVTDVITGLRGYGSVIVQDEIVLNIEEKEVVKEICANKKAERAKHTENILAALADKENLAVVAKYTDDTDLRKNINEITSGAGRVFDADVNIALATKEAERIVKFMVSAIKYGFEYDKALALQEIQEADKRKLLERLRVIHVLQTDNKRLGLLDKRYKQRVLKVLGKLQGEGKEFTFRQIVESLRGKGKNLGVLEDTEQKINTDRQIAEFCKTVFEYEVKAVKHKGKTVKIYSGFKAFTAGRFVELYGMLPEPMYKAVAMPDASVQADTVAMPDASVQTDTVVMPNDLAAVTVAMPDTSVQTDTVVMPDTGCIYDNMIEYVRGGGKFTVTDYGADFATIQARGVVYYIDLSVTANIFNIDKRILTAVKCYEQAAF